MTEAKHCSQKYYSKSDCSKTYIPYKEVSWLVASPHLAKTTLALVAINARFAVWKLCTRHNIIIEADAELLVGIFQIPKAAAALANIVVKAILTSA